MQTPISETVWDDCARELKARCNEAWNAHKQALLRVPEGHVHFRCNCTACRAASKTNGMSGRIDHEWNRYMLRLNPWWYDWTKDEDD